MVQTAETIWRNFVTNNVPSSGVNNPDKVEIRKWGTWVETIFTAVITAGGKLYASKAAMDADTAPAINTPAIVLGDATAANNGLYRKSAAAGSAGWTRAGDVPGYSYITATNAGAGTANAIQATTSIPIPAADGGALIALPIVADNTASPVTVSFNGGAALTVKTNSGNDVVAGGLTAGMIMAGYVSGATFRLLSDQASAAVLAGAEAARDSAQAWAEGTAPGGAGTKSAKEWADAALAAVPNVFPADRTALAAIDTATHTNAFFDGSNWQWNSSDLSAYVTADTQQGIYVAPSSDTTGASGAWVRVVPDGAWHTEWFGAETETTGAGTEPDLSGPLTAMINLANLVKPWKLVFGPGLFPLDSALPAFTYVVHIVGTKSTGGKGAAPSLLYKRYAEASTTRGVLSFSDWGFIVEDINIQSNNSVDATTVGGSAISAILTVNSPAASRTFLNRIRVSMGDGANYSLYVNGLSNTNPVGPSYRGTWVSECEFFGAASASIALIGVNHFFVAGTFTATSGGSSTIALQVAGNAESYNDDIQWHGGIFGKANLSWVSRSVFVSPMADNITVDANTTDTMWVGPRNYGTLINNAAPGEFTFVYDGMVVAQGGNNVAGWRKWGSGVIEQWGRGISASGALSVTWPVAFASVVNSVDARVTSDRGATFIGLAQPYSEGLTGCSIRTMDLGTGPNVALSGAAVQWHSIGA